MGFSASRCGDSGPRTNTLKACIPRDVGVSLIDSRMQSTSSVVNVLLVSYLFTAYRQLRCSKSFITQGKQQSSANVLTLTELFCVLIISKDDRQSAFSTSHNNYFCIRGFG